MQVRWCTTHSSVVIAAEDDPYDFWLCAVSNCSGDRTVCEIVLAEVTIN